MANVEYKKPQTADRLFVNLFLNQDLRTELNIISATKINKLVRPFYGDSSYQYNKPETDTLFSELGPFWYRGYYFGTKASSDQIDSTLSLFRVKHIATGHTIIADTVSVSYQGRIFDTDVHHAGGQSEALYVEGKDFYRATSVGEKFLIYSK